MFFLNKRKVFLILILALIVILFLNVKIFNNKKTVLTVALPVKNKIVILDAGHGYPDNGASSDEGITEANINLQITLKLQKLLEQSGCTVILTRSDENGIYNENSKTIRQKKVSDIKNRVEIGNNSNADIFISIHLNKIPQKQYWGWQTFYKKDNEQSKKLAKSLQDGLNETIQKENKREPLKIENIYIVDHVKIPISIVECGFLSNEEEEKLLQTEDYQNKLAWGIYLGINNYFNE